MIWPHCAKGVGRTTAALRVREKPNVDAPVIGIMALGQTFTVWAVDDNWAIVQTDGLTGWANTTYMKFGELTP